MKKASHPVETCSCRTCTNVRMEEAKKKAKVAVLEVLESDSMKKTLWDSWNQSMELGTEIIRKQLGDILDVIEKDLDEDCGITGWDVCHKIREKFKIDTLGAERYLPVFHDSDKNLRKEQLHEILGVKKKGKTLMEVFAQEDEEKSMPCAKRTNEEILAEMEEMNVPSKKWVKITRETGLTEYVCEHGCGHPDYKSAEKIAKKYDHSIGTWLTHGCDGCCGAKDFPGRNPTERPKKV